MNYQEALDYLQGVKMMGVKPELETSRHLLASLPLKKPLAAMQVIQVAGTNGKGSTSHFLASILQSAGYRTGLFTSPHLQDVRERVVIDNREAGEEEFAAAVSAVKETAQHLLAKGTIRRMPTYFEITFLTAVYCFSMQQVETVILEVGLGGRWDATTAITPDVAVITTIGRDHTELLGTKLRDIAAEKAGVIKPGVPVVCGCGIRTAAYRVIKTIALQNNAPFFPIIDGKNHLQVRDSQSPYRCVYTAADPTAPGTETYTFTVRLNGSHQALNAAAAIKTLRVLVARSGSAIRISPGAINRGIEAGRIPGRIEILETTPRVILDGSHNVESMTALTRFLAEQQKQRLTLVFGVLADKNYRQMIRLLQPYTGSVVLTRPVSDRALPPGKMIELFGSKNNGNTVLIENEPGNAYSAARLFSKEILVTGSFYLVGAMRQIIMKTTRRVRWTT